MDIGETLLRSGLITRQQLDSALQQPNGRRIDQRLIELGFVTEEDTLQTLGEILGMRYVKLKDLKIDPELLGKFPHRDIYRHSILPLERRNGTAIIATSDPFDLEALDELSSLSGLRLEPVLARKDDIVQIIKERLGVGGDTINELVAQRTDDDIELLEGLGEGDGELAEMAKAASVVKLVNELLIEALEQQSSDVHLEPQEKGLRIRYRVDGLLRVQPVPPGINQFQAAIISQVEHRGKAAAAGRTYQDPRPWPRNRRACVDHPDAAWRRHRDASARQITHGV
jgi:hypothetical protein